VEGERVASNGKELLGERYQMDHLTYEEIGDLGLTVVTENGEIVSPEELRGKIFRIVDPDEPSGYVVRNMETTGEGTTLCYLQASSS
jgi:hypothetical protein